MLDNLCKNSSKFSFLTVCTSLQHLLESSSFAIPSVNLTSKWTLKLFRKIVKTHHSYLGFHVWFLNLEALFWRIFSHYLSICRETTRGKAIRLWISEEFSYTQALTSPLPSIWFFMGFLHWNRWQFDDSSSQHSHELLQITVEHKYGLDFHK